MGASCSKCRGSANNGENPIYCSKCNPPPAGKVENIPVVNTQPTGDLVEYMDDPGAGAPTEPDPVEQTEMTLRMEALEARLADETARREAAEAAAKQAEIEGLAAAVQAPEHPAKQLEAAAAPRQVTPDTATAAEAEVIEPKVTQPVKPVEPTQHRPVAKEKAAKDPA